MTDNTTNKIELATELTVAWLANPNTRAAADDVPAFLASMVTAIGGLTDAKQDASATDVTEPTYAPAVSVRKSLASPDHIISMIDGKPYRTLKRHLTGRGLTPAEYRQRYGLKADYPMVAPAYSEARRATAKAIGLGRKAGEKVVKAVEKTVSKGRKSVADAKAAAKAHLGGANG